MAGDAELIAFSAAGSAGVRVGSIVFAMTPRASTIPSNRQMVRFVVAGVRRCPTPRELTSARSSLGTSRDAGNAGVPCSKARTDGPRPAARRPVVGSTVFRSTCSHESACLIGVHARCAPRALTRFGVVLPPHECAWPPPGPSRVASGRKEGEIWRSSKNSRPSTRSAGVVCRSCSEDS